ncbi:MAG: NADP-dependent oxidoreductase [Labilithrix sp.]|nr:NADP-dependent oxidoreductase [Labilithrix sp.]
MRAVMINGKGGLEVLGVGEREVRPAGPGEVRIRVKAAAVNPTDTLLRSAGSPKNPPPWTPGMDAAGTVESVGAGVERLQMGDAVMAIVDPRRDEGGAQCELIVVPAASAVKVPDGVSLAQASTLPMNGLTAVLGLDMIGLARGETLAVTGGAGVLAQYVIVLAKQRGLRVRADAKPADVELVKSFGADLVVARGEAFNREVLAAAPGGADGVFDTALLHEKVLGAIRDGGGIVTVRGWKGPTERGIVAHPVMVTDAFERTEWLEELRGLASSGAIELRVAAEYPPERIADAQRAMEAGGLRGRAVIVF